MNYQEYLKNSQERIKRNIEHLEKGVLFTDINTAYIEPGVVIEEGVSIGSNVTLEGASIIKKGAVIGANSRIKDSQIGEETEVQYSVILESKVGNRTKIGPFAYLRPGSLIGDNCKIGDFVEIKNSSFGNRSKASHLTYIGDADIEEDVNVGCGVVFVNYDGKNKYRSQVKKGAFIGCNTNLIAPVVVEEKSYIAAGSTVTVNVPKGALYIAREKGRIVEAWVKKRGLLDK